MTKNDFEAFAAALRGLAEAFAEPLSPDRVLVYFGALADHPIEAVRAAILSAVRRCERFPVPAVLLRMIEGDPASRAELAWRRVWSAIRRCGPDTPVRFEGPDAPAIHAALERLGGWREAAMWDVTLDAEQQGYRALEFRRLYQHFVDHPDPAAPEVLNCEALAVNKLRVIDDHGLPQPAAPALTDGRDGDNKLPTAPDPDAAEKIRALIAQVGRATIPEPARRRAVVERPVAVAPTAEELAEAERRRAEALARFRERYPEAAR